MEVEGVHGRERILTELVLERMNLQISVLTYRKTL